MFVFEGIWSFATSIEKFLKLLYSKPAETTVAFSLMTREANAM